MILKITDFTPIKPTTTTRKYLVEAYERISDRTIKGITTTQTHTDRVYKEWQMIHHNYTFNG